MCGKGDNTNKIKSFDLFSILPLPYLKKPDGKKIFEAGEKMNLVQNIHPCIIHNPIPIGMAEYKIKSIRGVLGVYINVEKLCF